MLGLWLVPSITNKSYFSIVGSGKTAFYSPSNTKFSLKYFDLKTNSKGFNSK